MLLSCYIPYRWFIVHLLLGGHRPYVHTKVSQMLKPKKFYWSKSPERIAWQCEIKPFTHIFLAGCLSVFICRVLSIHDSALCIRGFSLFIYLLAVSLYVAAIVSVIVPWLLWIVSQHFATHQTGSVHCSASWSAVCCRASGMPLLCVRCILLALSRAFLF